MLCNNMDTRMCEYKSYVFVSYIIQGNGMDTAIITEGLKCMENSGAYAVSK